jgi:hypothetical protein
MRRISATIAGLLILGACTSQPNSTTNTPSGDDASATDEGSSSHDSSSSSHKSSPPDEDPDETAGGGLSSGSPASISVLPCHVDESRPVAEAGPPAKPKPGKKPAAAKVDPLPPEVKQPITVAPKALAWGMGKKQLASIYDKQIDGDYKAKYKKVQPGPEMQALDAEVQENKDIFRRSVIDFGPTPTGIDATPLAGEYTYKNDEAMMKITRAGKTRDFFLIKDHLWKIVDELPLGEKEPWGKDFQEAVVKISAAYGVPGRICKADPEHGRQHTEVDWRDGHTQVRAIDWENGKFALMFVDLGTVAQLGDLRKVATPEKPEVDPSVQDVLHTPSQPPPKDDKKDKNKK